MLNLLSVKKLIPIGAVAGLALSLFACDGSEKVQGASSPDSSPSQSSSSASVYGTWDVPEVTVNGITFTLKMKLEPSRVTVLGRCHHYNDGTDSYVSVSESATVTQDYFETSETKYESSFGCTVHIDKTRAQLRLNGDSLTLTHVDSPNPSITLTRGKDRFDGQPQTESRTLVPTLFEVIDSPAMMHWSINNVSEPLNFEVKACLPDGSCVRVMELKCIDLTSCQAYETDLKPFEPGAVELGTSVENGEKHFWVLLKSYDSLGYNSNVRFQIQARDQNGNTGPVFTTYAK